MECGLTVNDAPSFQKMSDWDPQTRSLDPHYNESLHVLKTVSHLDMLEPTNVASQDFEGPSDVTSSNEDYYHQENDIVANAFSTATSSQSFYNCHPIHDPFHFASTPEENPPAYQHSLIDSPISPWSNEDSNFDSLNQTPPQNYHDVNRENNCYYVDYQFRHSSTYDAHTSPNILRQNEFDIDSDDLFKMDGDSAFYDLVDDFGTDMNRVEQCYSTSEYLGSV